jgi:hypothetical protein
MRFGVRSKLSISDIEYSAIDRSDVAHNVGLR